MAVVCLRGAPPLLLRRVSAKRLGFLFRSLLRNATSHFDASSRPNFFDRFLLPRTNVISNAHATPRAFCREESASDDRAIVEAFRADRVDAAARLFDRYSAHMERLLIRVLGNDPEIEDLLHEVFVQALGSIDRLRDPDALRPWLTRIAVYAARMHIRRRTRSRWLVFLPQEEVPEETTTSCPQTRDLAARVHAILGNIRNADERIAFVLRHVHGMTLPETADACSCSLATVKRRVARGKKAFLKQARRDRALCEAYGLEEES